MTWKRLGAALSNSKPAVRPAGPAPMITTLVLAVVCLPMCEFVSKLVVIVKSWRNCGAINGTIMMCEKPQNND